MRKATLFLSWSMLAGLCLVRAGAPTDPKEQAWKPLFDGKTMDGWQPADLYKPGPCSVKDGALCLKNGKPGENGPMTGIVSTRKDLPKKDYELRFQARRVEGDDFFATVTFPVGGVAKPWDCLPSTEWTPPKTIHRAVSLSRKASGTPSECGSLRNGSRLSLVTSDW